jgi:hypothetical protein
MREWESTRPTWIEYQIRCGWYIRNVISGDYGQCIFYQWCRNFLPMRHIHVADQVRLVLGPHPWATEGEWQEFQPSDGLIRH